MRKLTFVLKLCLLLSFELMVKGQMCPPNEIPSECEDTCNTCEGNRPCPLICIPGCQCIPGFTRDASMNCIPREFCPGFDKSGESTDDGTSDPEIQKLLEWEDNKKGCPNETMCSKHCRLVGSNIGKCIGPNKKHCYCVICEKSESELESKTGGCPNLLKCIRNCEKRGHKGGYCTGPKRSKCECLNSVAKVGSDALLDMNTVRGGCPNKVSCVVFCKSRNLATGICLGPKDEYCNCYTPNFANSAPKLGVEKSKPEEGITPRSGGCPNVAQCVNTCQRQRKQAGVCLGTGRLVCQCL